MTVPVVRSGYVWATTESDFLRRGRGARNSTRMERVAFFSIETYEVVAEIHDSALLQPPNVLVTITITMIGHISTPTMSHRFRNKKHRQGQRTPFRGIGVVGSKKGRRGCWDISRSHPVCSQFYLPYSLAKTWHRQVFTASTHYTFARSPTYEARAIVSIFTDNGFSREQTARRICSLTQNLMLRIPLKYSTKRNLC